MASTTINISAAGNDGWGYKGDTGDYTVIDARPFVDETTAGTTDLYIERSLNTGTSLYYISCAFLRFDTSTLSRKTIFTATLNLYATNINNANSLNALGDYYDYGGSPSDSTDWEHLSSGNAFSVALSSLTAGQVNSISLTEPNFYINKDGFTGIRLGVSQLAADAFPTGFNGIRPAASFEDAVNPQASLTITYNNPMTPNDLAHTILGRGSA